MISGRIVTLPDVLQHLDHHLPRPVGSSRKIGGFFAVRAPRLMPFSAGAADPTALFFFTASGMPFSDRPT